MARLVFMCRPSGRSRLTFPLDGRASQNTKISIPPRRTLARHLPALAAAPARHIPGAIACQTMEPAKATVKSQFQKPVLVLQ
jgi:hypothetical protein